MRRLRAALDRVARFPTAVLLTGETGTGKGAIARALHDASPRRDGPFVHVDCAGLVHGLLESELYGVAKGAFTGAQQARAGRFEAAGKGTLFLDEVGELSAAGQIKLLRVLEEGTFERVGETRTRRLGARVVAATHVDLEAAVARGAFRSDLFFRLRVLHLEVPPLRAQKEDLPRWLATASARAAQRLVCAAPEFSGAALARLRHHDWPGNLREFFHVVEAATVLSEGRCIEAGLLDELLRPLGRGASIPISHPGAEPGRGSGRAHQGMVADEVERAHGNLSLAARRLGIPRSTLRYRLGLDDALSRGRRLRAVRSTRAGSRPE
jgi:DNA-binding NtrC family response regulator